MIGDFCGVTKYLLAICFRENKPLLASPMAQVIKYLLSMQETQETWVQSLSQEDLLEKEMATHFNILAWENP